MSIAQAMKRGVRGVVRGIVNGAARTRMGRLVYEEIINVSIARTQTVSRNGNQYVFAVPNVINHFRIDTFASKEPETLDWIDAIPQGSVLWDIGANIGLYSCYAAKSRRCRVFAFEPSVFNLELLARNIYLNGLVAEVTIVPLPLTETRGTNRLRMTSTEWGGALSTFGESFGFDGRPIHPIFEFHTLGISMADAQSLLEIPQPEYIKMDVDGIEHLILAGGSTVLQRVRSILVEINENFGAQSSQATRLLSGAGLRLRDKHQWAEAAAASDSPYAATYNQIWVRESST